MAVFTFTSLLINFPRAQPTPAATKPGKIQLLTNPKVSLKPVSIPASLLRVESTSVLGPTIETMSTTEGPTISPV